jgi:histidyl-tRNA synthetase
MHPFGSPRMQRLPGFRDFYPEDCAVRNYVFATWRQVARSFGFQEYDAPTLEPTDLYRRKSGEELKTQLFRFEDQGGRDVCLRPEMTPTLARLVAARERDFRKPMKWFSIAPFFRFEKPQKGRLREFYQINCDIIGDNSPAADAELIALSVALHRAFGLTSDDFFVRVNNRHLWSAFLQRIGQPSERTSDFLQIIDKWERDPTEVSRQKLEKMKINFEQVRDYLVTPADQLPGFESLFQELQWRGLDPYVQLDLTIVRGLDYYTGLVFEVFDRKKENRALAGGGRYDSLISAISDGASNLPAAGFAVGDLVLTNFIQELPHTKKRLESAIAALRPIAYVVIADEARRDAAIEIVGDLRAAGLSVDYPFHPAKVGKQFQQAEVAGATYAIVIGQEWPRAKIKTLADRSERLTTKDEIVKSLVASS